MEFTVDPYGRVEFNLRSTTHGGGALKQYEDDRTLTSHGNLHSRVSLKDIGIVVTMDSDPDGKWDYPEWSRAAAWKALRPHLTLEILVVILDEAKKAAFQAGQVSKQIDVCKALGLSGDLVYNNYMANRLPRVG